MNFLAKIVRDEDFDEPFEEICVNLPAKNGMALEGIPINDLFEDLDNNNVSLKILITGKQYFCYLIFFWIGVPYIDNNFPVADFIFFPDVEIFPSGFESIT